MRRFRRTLECFALALGLLAITTGPARAASDRRDLLLEVYINGADTQEIGAFTEIDGALFATAKELRELGIVVPASKRDDELVPLKDVAGLTSTLDERAQAVRLALPMTSLATHRLDIDRRPDATFARATSTGAVFNYDVTSTYGRGRLDTYGFGSARLFGPFGLAQADFIAAQSGSSARFTRLDTTYSYSDPAHFRTYAAGDVISGSLPYSRSVRLGGVQVSSNFGLRPDLITYPLPVVSGGTAVPSTVDVLVNGVRQISQPVGAGPFYIPRLPFVGGAGQVSVAVRDAAGQQTVQTSSFYIAPALMRPGLGSYSIEAGAVRRNFGVDSNNYGAFAASATGRLGLTTGITIEGHVEASGKLAQAMTGATVKLGNFAVASGSFGFSTSSRGAGTQAYASVQRLARWYQLGASIQLASPGYRDIAAFEGDASPKRIIQANAGATLGRQGSLGITYTDIEERGPTTRIYGPVYLPGGASSYTRPPTRASLLAATYSRTLFGRASAYVTGYRDMRTQRGAVMLGVSMAFGARDTASASYESESHQATVEVSRQAYDPGQVGYRAYASSGRNSRALGEVEYRGTWGDVGLGVDHYGGDTYVRARSQGAVVVMGGGAFATNTVADGFAVVDDGGFGNVGVIVNNRPVGKTNAKGRLLIPRLISYQPNKVELDPTDLPLDAQWDRLEERVTPSDRAGTVAHFTIRRTQPLLLTVRLPDGTPVPLGSIVSEFGGGMTPTTVGFDGQLYFADLSGHHDFSVGLPGGNVCTISIEGKPHGDGDSTARETVCKPAAMPSSKVDSVASR